MDSAQRASAGAHGRHLALPVAPVEAGFSAVPERAAAVAQDLVEVKARIAIGGSALDQMTGDSAGDFRAIRQANVVQSDEIELDERLRTNLADLKVRLTRELHVSVARLRRCAGGYQIIRRG